MPKNTITFLSLLLSFILINACQSHGLEANLEKNQPVSKKVVKKDYHQVLANELSNSSQLKIGEINRFIFSNWTGPDLPAWIYLPNNVDLQTAPILIMLHGAKRNSHRYLREWRPLAEAKGFIVVSPEYSKKDFPKSAGYNLGNVFAREGKGMQDESIWSFSVIEPLFDNVVSALKGQQQQYTLFGHSAGSQFVHRYLYYKPDARVKRYITANAGWYTLPDLSEKYPYGLNGAGVSEEQLKTALSKEVVVLLGNKDNNPKHKSLRRTTEAMRQGAHRFARGRTYFAVAKYTARQYQIPFNWSIQVVDGVAHSNGKMAAAAVKLDLIE